jgi:hypothetical protein
MWNSILHSKNILLVQNVTHVVCTKAYCPSRMALDSLVAISGPKLSRFQGPSLLMALVMDLPVSKNYVPRAI